MPVSNGPSSQDYKTETAETQETPRPAQEVPAHPPARVTRTVALVFSWVCMGLFSEITGPTLPYLKFRVSSDYEQISRALFARSVGFFFGSSVGGVLCEKYNHHIDLMISAALFLAALGTAIAPWCRLLPLLATMVCLDGVGKGLLASGGNSYVIQIWQEKAAVPVHALHSAFGVGALIAPQIVRPFIPDAIKISNMTTSIGNSANASLREEVYEYEIPFNTSVPVGSESHIEHAYTIISVITLLCGVFFVVLWCFSYASGSHFGRTSHRSILKILSPSSCVQGHKPFGLLMLTFMFVFFALIVGAERAYGKFLFSFALTSEVAMGKNEATVLDSAFWASFTAGRALATIAAKWTSPIVAISVEIVLNLVSAIILSIAGYKVKIVLWIFTCTFGAFLSPLFPAGMAWANQYMEMTAVVTSVAFIGSAVGAMLFSWISGYLFEYHGPTSLMFLMLAYSLALSVFFICVYFFARRHGKKSISSIENKNRRIRNE